MATPGDVVKLLKNPMAEVVEDNKAILRLRYSDGIEAVFRKKTYNGHNLLVYTGHNEMLGVVYSPEHDYVSPNMPKIKYAYTFTIKGTDAFINGLSPEAQQFTGQEGYYFVKRDGFNVLFYKPPYADRIIPKTRLLPIASEKTAKVVQLLGDDFLNNVREMVKDGFIPIFEVWGETLKEYEITNGGSKVGIVKEIEGIDEDPIAELIAVRVNTPKFKEKDYTYNFVPPDELIKLAEDYGLKTPPYVKDTVSFKVVKGLIDRVNRVNNEYETIVYEGYVLHVGDWNNYRMFKIKPELVLIKDVALKNIENAEELINKVEYEVSKILLDYDVTSIIVRDFDEALDELRKYLSEDIPANILDNIWWFTMDVFLMKVVSGFFREEHDCKELLELIRSERKKGMKPRRMHQKLINAVLGKCREMGKL